MFANDFVQVMANTWANATREVDDNEDQEVPLKGNKVPPKVPNAPQVGNVTL